MILAGGAGGAVRSLQLNSRQVAALALALSLSGWVAIAIVRPEVPGSMLWGAGLLTLVGASVAAFWSWRERQQLQDGVEKLIGAFERLGRGEFSQPLAGDLAGHLGRLERAFERTRLALNDTSFSRDYLHSVLNSMGDSVFVTDPDGTIRMVNDAARRMTGYSDDELLGTRVAGLLAPAAEGVDDPVAAAREAGE